MSSVLTKSSKKKDKRQVNEQNCNLERDCRIDNIGITRHIMMHQVLYMQLPNEEGDMHIT